MKLIGKRTLLCPTLAGWLVIALLLLGSIVFGALNLYPFLAINNPIAAELLVVEGWLPDQSLPAVGEHFQRAGCSRIITTGGPHNYGSELRDWPTYAEASYERLRRFGISASNLICVPAPDVARDRTYHSALALRRELDRRGDTRSLNVVTLGPHARRTQFLFELALGDEREVGVIALEPARYRAEAWWRCSDGVRGVIDEWIAWIYAKFFFQPEELSCGS